MEVLTTLFVSFQLFCLIFAVVYTCINTYRIKGTHWFYIYMWYLFAITALTIRRMQVLLEGRPAATAQDTLIWQTIAAVGFLICSAMAYALIKSSKK